MGEKVLVVDDSPELAHAIVVLLKEAGYRVDVAHDGEQALEHLSRYDPSLVILAEKMGRRNGWAICREIREISAASLMALMEDESEEREVSALRAGVDTCLARPFSPRILIAKVGALMRRQRSDGANAARSAAIFGELVIDAARSEARLAGQRLDLSSTEFRLLAALASRPGQVVTTEQLMDELWDSAWRERGVRAISLKQFVWRLRRKIEGDAQRPRYVLSKRGIGYYLGDGRSMAG